MPPAALAASAAEDRSVNQYQAFRVELADKVANVVINRPEKINAMNAAFWTEIIDIFNWIDETDDVRVVVLSGAGAHFSSGIDLQLLAQVGGELGKDVGRNAEKLRRKILSLQASFNAVDNCRKPVIAAIQGYCLGGAIDLDLRVATCATAPAMRSFRSRKSTWAWRPMSVPYNGSRESSATA